MYVKCEFKEFTPEPERHFVIQFTVILAVNSQYDLTPIEILLSEQNEDENPFKIRKINNYFNEQNIKQGSKMIQGPNQTCKKNTKRLRTKKIVKENCSSGKKRNLKNKAFSKSLKQITVDNIEDEEIQI